MNEPNEELPPLFSDDEIARMKRSGREVGTSERYRPSDEQLAVLADVVTKVQDRQGTGELGSLTPENLRLKHAGGRRIARQVAARISADRDPLEAKYDRAIMGLVRQAFIHERSEVVFSAIIERIGAWD